MRRLAGEERTIWGRWVIANGLGEFIGLTTTLAMTAGLFSANDDLGPGAALLAAAGVAVAGAAVEGVVVGFAQWSVLRRALPQLQWRPWVRATAVGALVAWLLGMMPSTFFQAMAATAETTSVAPAFDPPLILQLVMAAVMGFALGPILGIPQWLVLRAHLPRVGRWVLANAVAWTAGMPMIFLATGLIGTEWTAAQIGATVAVGCLAAGLVVGAVHGLWLVRMLAEKDATPVI
jgi:hypothetical protein